MIRQRHNPELTHQNNTLQTSSRVFGGYTMHWRTGSFSDADMGFPVRIQPEIGAMHPPKPRVSAGESRKKQRKKRLVLPSAAR